MVRILFADSKKYVSKNIQHQLNMLGYDVHACSDGIQVMEVYDDFKPDITFQDIDLFKKSGEECLTEIKKRDSKSIVIMTSTFPGEEYEVEFNIKVLALKEKGADGFLLKPILKDQVLRKINEMIKG